ncbi:MAG: hypothetical protein ACFFG0_42210 [Candidatus Thorarchaeota archaeon]
MRDIEEIFLRLEGRHKDYLVTPFLTRIGNWMKKANLTKDSFDKYIANFIAFNMLYNLWHKMKNPKAKEKQSRDCAKLMATLELIDLNCPLKIKDDVDKLRDILIKYGLVVEIYEWKNKKYEFVGLAQDVLEEYCDENEESIKYLLKTLYKIRCNLVHGEKDYEERQNKLLNQSSFILEKILFYLIGRLEKLTNLKRKK